MFDENYIAGPTTKGGAHGFLKNSTAASSARSGATGLGDFADVSTGTPHANEESEKSEKDEEGSFDLFTFVVISLAVGA